MTLWPPAIFLGFLPCLSFYPSTQCVLYSPTIKPLPKVNVGGCLLYIDIYIVSFTWTFDCCDPLVHGCTHPSPGRCDFHVVKDLVFFADKTSLEQQEVDEVDQNSFCPHHLHNYKNTSLKLNTCQAGWYYTNEMKHRQHMSSSKTKAIIFTEHGAGIQQAGAGSRHRHLHDLCHCISVIRSDRKSVV